MAPKKTLPSRGSATAMKRGRSTKKEEPEPEALSSTADFEMLLQQSGTQNDRYVLKLYVTGTTYRAAQAIASIRALCDEHLVGRYDLEVIDIYQQPNAAALEQIIAAPTLIKQEPAPVRRMVGNLSDHDKILLSLNIQAEAEESPEIKETRWLKV